jgi:hypothetical protein
VTSVVRWLGDGRTIAQVDSDGAILWATTDQRCISMDGYSGLGPLLRRRREGEDIVAYLPAEVMYQLE